MDRVNEIKQGDRVESIAMGLYCGATGTVSQKVTLGWNEPYYRVELDNGNMGLFRKSWLKKIEG